MLKNTVKNTWPCHWIILGDNDKILIWNKSAVSIVTGIIDGTGSVGAALGQVAIPVIETKVGWSQVFYLFISMAAVSCK